MGKKDRKGVVYSTNKDFQYNHFEDLEAETLSPDKQRLKVAIDRKLRKGKEVTLVTGFVGQAEDLKTLGKMLKSKCGVGGTVKDGNVEVQGNQVDKVKKILKDEGYVVK